MDNKFDFLDFKTRFVMLIAMMLVVPLVAIFFEVIAIFIMLIMMFNSMVELITHISDSKKTYDKEEETKETDKT